VTMLSKPTRDKLQAELNDLKDALFVGVLVGVGSIILQFANGSTLLVQCPFAVQNLGVSHMGHGETADTSMSLFGLLNEQVSTVLVDASGQTTLEFGTSRSIRIIPDHSGYESYVVRTSKGVFPVF
jgi:hypothetical protein